MGAAVFIGLSAGAIGASYPGSLLGERHAPGLAAGVLLGIVGGLATAPAWATFTAISVASDPDSAALRAVAHAGGTSQLKLRAWEFLALVRLAAVTVALAAVGGLIATVAESTVHGSANAAMASHPSIVAVGVALSVWAGALTLGFLVGIASGDGGRGIVITLAALAGGAILVGASYFSPAVSVVASCTPAGILLVMVREQIVAPQFTTMLSGTAAAIAAPAWISALLGIAVLQIRRRVW
jgi:hypothetical protein